MSVTTETSERAITIFTTVQGDNVTARERFFKKLQQQQNPRRTAVLDGSAAADIARFRQQMAALAQQVSQWFD
ncbi:hypothetical protein [Klebsiella variicola]|uniref:hypothetical protein n=1 Tax=Klebsiella variicola TaxID=244366 RepID=UPI002B05E10E|nr:hypothetical protein [Klebsiella variicola]